MRNINLIFHVQQYHHNGIVRTKSVDKFGNPTVIKRSYFESSGDHRIESGGVYRKLAIVTALPYF